jgi:hypothetical protein
MRAKHIYAVPLIAAGIAALHLPAAGWAAERRTEVLQSSDRSIVESAARSGVQSAMETMVMVKMPATPFELLENVKIALDQGLLLREDFYTDENLKRFSGGTKVRRSAGGQDVGPKYIFCSVTEFGAMVEPRIVGNIVIPGISVGFRRTILEDGRVAGSVSVRLQQGVPSLSFDEVTKLFGPHWTYSKDILSPHMRMESPRKPHGNARIEYRAADVLHILSFNRDALLDSAEFRLQGEGK